MLRCQRSVTDGWSSLLVQSMKFKLNASIAYSVNQRSQSRQLEKKMRFATLDNQAN